MKKKISLLAVLFVLFATSAICDELEIVMKMYIRKKGNGTETDWPTFYARMSEYANRSDYNYIYVSREDGEDLGEVMLYIWGSLIDISDEILFF